MRKLSSLRYFSSYAPLRNPAFATIKDSDLSFFESVVGRRSGMITNEEEVAPYNSDWTHKFVGNSKLVLRPNSTEEVAALLTHCNDRKLAVVPQGGNTGLVGGSNPVYDEIILSMSRMNRVLGFDDSYGILSTESGCILEVC